MSWTTTCAKQRQAETSRDWNKICTKDGLRPYPKKVKAVNEMPNPTDVAWVRRLLGFVHYLSKFLLCLSDICEPVYNEILIVELAWDSWPSSRENQKLVTYEPIFSYYNPNKELTLQSDSAEKELGA